MDVGGSGRVDVGGSTCVDEKGGCVEGECVETGGGWYTPPTCTRVRNGGLVFPAALFFLFMLETRYS